MKTLCFISLTYLDGTVDIDTGQRLAASGTPAADEVVAYNFRFIRRRVNRRVGHDRRVAVLFFADLAAK